MTIAFDLGRKATKQTNKHDINFTLKSHFWCARGKILPYFTQRYNGRHYHIPINDTSFELSVFWPSYTESRINPLRFSESISLSFKTRLTLGTCLAATLKIRIMSEKGIS